MTTFVTTPKTRQPDFRVDEALAACGCRWDDCTELLDGRWEPFVSHVRACPTHDIGATR